MRDSSLAPLLREAPTSTIAYTKPFKSRGFKFKMSKVYSSQTYGHTMYGFIQAACDMANLPLLPPHLPVILLSFSAYQIIYMSLGPWLSTRLFPKTYTHLRGKEKVNWDENVPSLVQAIVISSLSSYVILCDQDRRQWNWQGRVWGYSEPTALSVDVANGYFYWHLQMMVRHRAVFGWGMVVHAIAVAFLFTNGYVRIRNPQRRTAWDGANERGQRPAFMAYSPSSSLFEFSTIFLDVQMALRALQMEGTTIQIVNGLALFLSFFLARILYGTRLQFAFYSDIWSALTAKEAEIPAGHERIPIWLLAGHLLSGIILQGLNYWWFYKIGRTVFRKLFVKKIAKE